MYIYNTSERKKNKRFSRNQEVILLRKKFIILAATVSTVMGSSVGVLAETPIIENSTQITSEVTSETSDESTITSSENEEITDDTISDNIEDSGQDNLEEEQGESFTQYIDEDGNKYLLYSDGTHYTGWYDMQPFGELYFDSENDGAAVINSTKDIDGKVYLFDENGVTKETSGTPIVNGEKYWVQSDGTLGSGWLYLGSWKMYFDPETYQAKTVTDAVTDINGKKYLFNKDGVMQNYAGTTIIDGKKYWFSTDDASLKTGWLTLGDWNLYFDSETYECATGIKEIDGEKYLFDSNGILQTSGTPIVNGEKYWIKSDGSFGSGWLYLGDWKMYFVPETNTASIGIVNIDGKDYLFNNDGVMQNFAGTTVVNGKKYWFSTDDASLKSGWLSLGNVKLYFDPTTYAAYTSTTATIDGITYEFDSNGCATKSSDDSQIDSHTHEWQPIYTTVHHNAVYQTVHHDAVTHQEQVKVGENPIMEDHVICDCGLDLHGMSEEEAIAHSKQNGCYGSYSQLVQVGTEPIYETQTITDQAAYDEQVLVQDAYDEQVVSGYSCSCGATK